MDSVILGIRQDPLFLPQQGSQGNDNHDQKYSKCASRTAHVGALRQLSEYLKLSDGLRAFTVVLEILYDTVRADNEFNLRK
jgi:hypothetical protein